MKWITSGPVQTTVGFIEDNSVVPAQMTFQEVCDAVFYGNAATVSVPDYVQITETCEVTVCVHGQLALMRYAELYQNDTLIATLNKEDFEDGCVTVDSNPITEDTTFDFKVYYTSGAELEATATVKCAMPVFVGLLPKWEYGNTVSMKRLKELEAEDTEGTQNRFLTESDAVESITFKYVFQDSKLRHPFVVVAESYPDLKSMTTKSQEFGIEAFNVIDMIPLHIDGVDKDVIFKMYIYKQALSSLNQEVTFNFESK